MKSYKEMAESVFERRDAHIAKRKRAKIQLLRFGVPAVSLVLIITMSAVVLNKNFRKFPQVEITSSQASVSTSSLLSSDVSLAPSSPSSLPSVVSSQPVSSHEKTPSKVPSSSADKPPKPQNSVQSSGKDNFTFTSIKALKDKLNTLDLPLTSNQNIAADRSRPTVNSPTRFPSAVITPSDSVTTSTASSTIPSTDSSQTIDSNNTTSPPGDSDFPGAVEPSTDTSSEATISQPSYNDTVACPPPMADAPAADRPAADSPSAGDSALDRTPTEIEQWEDRWYFFEDGTFLMPALQEGNETFKLKSIHVTSSSITYWYRFVDKSLRNSAKYDLQIKLPSSKTLNKKFVNSLMLDEKTKRYVDTNSNLSFYVAECTTEHGDYVIGWYQQGCYYVAYYYGDYDYIPALISELSMVSVRWN